MSDAHRDEIAKLEALYAENPGGRIFTHLAEACRKAGDLERAREVLTDGIEMHPDYSSAHVVLGRVLMDQGDHDQARAEFQRVLELDGHNLVALRSLGDIARTEGKIEEALDRYHQLLDLEPSDSEARDLVDELTEGLVVPGPEADESPAQEPLVEGSTAWDEPAAAQFAGDEDVWDEPAADESAADTAWDEAVLEEPAAEEPAAEESAWDEAVVDEATAEAAWDEAVVEEPAEDTLVDPEEAEEAWSEAGDLESDDWSTEAPVVEEDTWTGAEATDEDEFAEAAEEPAAEGADAEDVDVMTETIAQVYARQGLYDRAAEVYRELVRTRPDDQGLRDQLAEMEARASESADAGSGMEGLQTEEDSGPGLEVEEDESFVPEEAETVEGFETVEFDAEDEEPEVAPLPGLETEESDPATGLADVEPEPEIAEPDEPEAAEEWVEVEVDDDPDPWAADVEEEVDAEIDGESDPWAADAEEDTGQVEPDAVAAEAAAEPEAVEPAHADEAEPESPWTGEDWSEEEAETPYAWAESEEGADESQPIRSYLTGVLDWGDAASPGESEPVEAGEAVEAKEPADAADESAEPEAGGTESAVKGPDAGSTSADDEDLDTFRSWLESLKE